jgi:adenosine deaminase CECR1
MTQIENWFNTQKQQDTLYSVLRRMPKGGDLHNHLSGSGHPEWWFEAAYKFGYLQNLSPEQKRDWIRAAEQKENRDTLVRMPHVLAEIMFLNMKPFGEEGVSYVEFQIPRPTFYNALKARLNKQDAIDTNVMVRFQGCVRRGHNNKECNYGPRPSIQKQLDKINSFVQKSDLCVGINFIDHKYHNLGYTGELDVFQDINVPLSIHAGETMVANSHIKEALGIGANRIGHGLNLIHDLATMNHMIEHAIPLEVCLSSNKHFNHIVKYEDYPLAACIRKGVPVVLCTDDRGYWSGTLTDEFFIAVTTFDLNWNDVKQLCRNSLEYAFVDDTTKAQLLDTHDKKMQQFEIEMLLAV